MPKDKTESHARIKDAAKQEFLEKGFEKASMREIGRKVGMTQAALYRHYASKEEMFCDLVEPFLEKLKLTGTEHMQTAYQNFDQTASAASMMQNNMVGMLKNLMTDYRDELRLLVCCAHGTRYENFVHDIVHEETKETLRAFDYIRKHGAAVPPIQEDELHVLLSAYFAAALEPIVHDWPREKSMHCLDLIEAFFVPAWKHFMGC